MDNPTKYEHPDFFLFLNLYFFFGDCETRALEKPADRLAKEVKYLLPLPARVCQSIPQTNTLNIRIVPPLESVNLQHSISVYEALLGGEHVIA
ncbi:hypothetical protein [Arsenophonus sp. PmNCSU2021_1]|uniref:hypothetical protein n=1 Tax=Arsenophonus sp. PmNCSU2021_1 TaxID=3118989 RepID=UPI002FF26341